MREIADTNNFCIETFKDHCELIWTSDVKKSQFEEEMEQIRLENTRISNEIKHWESKNQNELTYAEEDYEKSTQEYGDKFKDQSNL